MTNGHFFADLSAGQTVKATMEVTSLNPGKKHAALRTVRTVGDEPAIEGEAYVQVSSRR